MCLGEQLLADALGGSVKPMTAPPEVGLSEITIVSDPIFAGITEICPCFQWHGAEVVTLPPGARLLATSPGCAVQAFAIGQHAYGLQFHMELTETTAAEWGALPEYAAALEAVQGEGALGRLATEVAENLPMLETAARTVFQNFLIIAEGVISRKSAA
jgi:GMP synthase-like glutamine amidotransferase